MKHILAVAVGIAIIFGFLLLSKDGDKSFGLAVCTPVESVVTVGDDISSTIVSAGARSWAIIQQPLNATNTVSLSLGGTAVSGQGYTLYPTVTGSTTDNLRIGFATDLPTSVAVTGITETASSTLNVTVCR